MKRDNLERAIEVNEMIEEGNCIIAGIKSSDSIQVCIGYKMQYGTLINNSSTELRDINIKYIDDLLIYFNDKIDQLERELETL